MGGEGEISFFGTLRNGMNNIRIIQIANCKYQIANIKFVTIGNSFMNRYSDEMEEWFMGVVIINSNIKYQISNIKYQICDYW